MRNPDRQTTFHFRQFSMSNALAGMKVGTDGVLLAAWALSDSDLCPRQIVDAGAGTGVISLIMAQRFPQAEITAVEIAPEAASEARMNFAASPWSERLEVFEGDFGELARKGILTADLLVSNPPFFTNGALAPDVSRRLARHAGTLSPESLIKACSVLTPQGRLCMISMAEDTPHLEYAATVAGMGVERLTLVTTAPGKAPRRALWQLRRGACAAQRDTLTIRTADGQPTDAYRRLVEPYYITVK